LLRATGLIRELRAEIKVLGDGDLKIALIVHAHKFSKSAEEKITGAGGKVELLT
jgi:large subunit ribosomal protein L15